MFKRIVAALLNIPLVKPGNENQSHTFQLIKTDKCLPFFTILVSLKLEITSTIETKFPVICFNVLETFL